MKFRWAKEVTNLQIDITSFCNARCGACVRNKDGDEVKDELILEHFDMEVWERLASKDTHGWFIGKLTLNGNWGDPMMHPKLVEMLDIWTTYHPETCLYLHTNGSMRTKKFWTDMGSICKRFTNHLVVFAVDGMEDTHAIYRRKTDFNKIVENIKAFTSVGGRASVTMTLFEHNKHQVKQVEELAWEVNALRFQMRHSHGDNLLVDLGKDSYRIHACYDIDEYDKQNLDFDNKWNMSDNRDYNIHQYTQNQLEFKQKLEGKTVCPWYNDREVQIDPWGVVWPCCHTSLFGVDTASHNPIELVDASFIEARVENSLKKYSLPQVLSNDWFTGNLNDALNSGSWKQCQNICGVECGV